MMNRPRRVRAQWKSILTFRTSQKASELTLRCDIFAGNIQPEETEQIEGERKTHHYTEDIFLHLWLRAQKRKDKFSPLFILFERYANIPPLGKTQHSGDHILLNGCWFGFILLFLIFSCMLYNVENLHSYVNKIVEIHYVWNSTYRWIDTLYSAITMRNTTWSKKWPP